VRSKREKWLSPAHVTRRKTIKDSEEFAEKKRLHDYQWGSARCYLEKKTFLNMQGIGERL